MRIAVIDLGTNTFSILIADLLEGDFTTVFRRTIAVKLGEGGINQNLISEIPFARGINALKEIRKEMDLRQVDVVKAIATSAIRGASNKNDFIQAAKKEANIDIELIDGEREAELIFKGVNKSIAINKPLVMMDIGGGSTEFIITDQKDILWKKSYLLGVSRLIEKFKPHNPMGMEEIEQVKTYLKQEISDFFEYAKNNHITTLVGVAGPYETYAEMIAYRFDKPHLSPPYKSVELNMSEALVIHEDLLTSTYDERLNMKGLLTLRADMMVMSSIFMHLIIQELNIQTLWVSSFSLREGVVYDFMELN